MYNTKWPEFAVAASRKGPYDGNMSYAYQKRGQVNRHQATTMALGDFKLEPTVLDDLKLEPAGASVRAMGGDASRGQVRHVPPGLDAYPCGKNPPFYLFILVVSPTEIRDKEVNEVNSPKHNTHLLECALICFGCDCSETCQGGRGLRGAEEVARAPPYPVAGGRRHRMALCASSLSVISALCIRILYPPELFPMFRMR